MAEEKIHILSAIILGAITWPVFGIGAAYAIAFGAMFPDIDVLWKGWHRSWVTHTAFAPSIISYSIMLFPSLGPLAPIIPFFAFGIVAHVILDFVDYNEFKGSKLPINPVLSSGKWPDTTTLVLMLISQIPFLLYGLV